MTSPDSYKISEIERVVTKMDVKLDRLDDRLDSLEKERERTNIILEKQESTLSDNTDSLKEHMRRTEALEKSQAEDKAVRKFIMWIVGVVGVSGVGAALKWFIGQ